MSPRPFKGEIEEKYRVGRPAKVPGRDRGTGAGSRRLWARHGDPLLPALENVSGGRGMSNVM